MTPPAGRMFQLKNPIHIYKVAGDYNVRLTITTENGCTQSLKKKSIHVYGLPVVSAGTDVTVCTGDSIQLAVQGALQYVWKPSDFVSDSVAQDPFVFRYQPQILLLPA